MSKFGDYMHSLWHVTHPGQSCGEEGEETVISDISLQRQMLYDAFNDPEILARLTGLPPISDEVVEMEQRAHTERMEKIVPVIPLLLGQSGFMGHAAAMLQCAHVEDAPDYDVQIEAVHQVFTNIITASVISSVSTAVALGVLQVAKGVTVE